MDWLSRTELLLGKEKLDRLRRSSVLVMGLGGVGAYAAELICRAGVGTMTIADGDVINPTNRNRQLPALISNQGKSKARVMQERLLDINPELNLTVIEEYVRDERMVDILRAQKFDYVVDAIDTISPKLFLMIHCLELGYPIVSSMGAGGKTEPSAVRYGDISESKGCPLARVLRKRLHRRGIYTGITAVWSSEEIDPNAVITTEGEQNKKSNVGTISYMPPLFGCVLASVVIRGLSGGDTFRK
jgi:tRNA A37 threonylcarbamoyladenosine dehydratase